jgi:GT2 family glycosyltransferase
MTARPRAKPCGSTAASLLELFPSVGWPVTICVLCYGPNVLLARRFFDSLYGNTDPSLFCLRVGLNEVEKATAALVQRFSARFKNIETYSESTNVFKNPLMRRMFHQKPIASKWTIWCDDDTHFTRSDWLQRLALLIAQSPKVAMLGWVHALWRRDRAILHWIRNAAWYRGVKFLRGLDPDGNAATEFRFAPGAFWAIRTKILYHLNWPDERLLQANEDFLLGEALRQNGFALANFNYGLKINDAERRNPSAAAVSDILIR